MTTTRSLVAMAMASAMAIGASSANAAVIDDQFDDGDLATNTTGVGSGFSLFQYADGWSGGTAVESGGTVNIKGNGENVVTQIVSNDAIDPTDLTLTWGIDSALTTGAATYDGVGLGWIAEGGVPTAPTIVLEMRGDRLTFDFIQASGFTRQVGIAHGNAVADATYAWDGTSPLTVELVLGATDWSLSVTGTGVSVNQSGLYTGFATGGLQVAGSTSTLGTILAASGGSLSTYATAYREPGDAVFDYVTVVPEPASLALIGLGGLLMLRRRK